ncbi:MAG: hypothetical protein ACK5Q5_03170 [Planctomycetaceae bacterium]
MAIDPRQLKPSELVRLLNSTPLGEVISERQLYRDRQRAGFRIGDGNRVDLVRYAAWLASERHNPKPAPTGESYDQHKDRAARRSAELSAAGRDIGDLPAIADPPCARHIQELFDDACDRGSAGSSSDPNDGLRGVMIAENRVKHGVFE